MGQMCRVAAVRRSLVLVVGVVGVVFLAASARAQVADPQPAPDPQSATAAPDPETALPGPSSPSFWTRRHAGLMIGFGASVAAATVAWLNDRDVRARKQTIQALPPGMPDVWNQQVGEATGVLRARDFWRDTAIGIGGFTLACLVLTPSRDARQVVPLRDRVPAPAGRTWVASVGLAAPAFSVTHFF